jgi:hypothetical protein
MSRSRRRLLAALLLSLVVLSSTGASLRAQDGGARVPLNLPKLSPLPHPTPAEISPLGIHLPPRNPAPPGAPVFPQIVRAAGIIFSGYVTFVGPTGPTSAGNAASTAITFHVEHAFRGVYPGQDLSIHEWASLWNRGERYRVGERVFLFLYSPGRFGLTSPVSGPLGRFEMAPNDEVLISPQHMQILAPDPELGGRDVVPLADFTQAVQRFKSEE